MTGIKKHLQKKELCMAKYSANEYEKLNQKRRFTQAAKKNADEPPVKLTRKEINAQYYKRNKEKRAQQYQKDKHHLSEKYQQNKSQIAAKQISNVQPKKYQKKKPVIATKHQRKS